MGFRPVWGSLAESRSPPQMPDAVVGCPAECAGSGSRLWLPRHAHHRLRIGAAEQPSARQPQRSTVYAAVAVDDARDEGEQAHNGKYECGPVQNELTHPSWSMICL